MSMGDDTGDDAGDRELSPAARAHEESPRGAPIRLADGCEWRLAFGGLTPLLDDLRDRLFDDSALAGKVDREDVLWAAFALLARNYDLTMGEIPGLFAGVPLQPIADAVMAAVIGRQDGHVTYSTWARSAMHANGVDPGRVPAELVPYVLDHLVASGRAIPAEKLVSSAEAAAKRREIAATFDD